ncbi:MAG: M48 family metalloprotease [Pseudomonadales bacterium]|nr:M48 family metalloprotease [Verrucomicrobiae bacterium]MCP5183659.1 M48 family metalloprotease [Pseudomonadales bacterium]
MQIEELRAGQDRELHRLLLEDPDVRRVNEEIARHEDKGNLGVRRHLLNTSVRLSTGMASELHGIADECRARLGLEIPLELYVFPSPTFNAACVKPESGRLFIMFSSSLLEAFCPAEIRFVMGHELGHHLFHHHDIPIGYILRGQQRPNPKLALSLTSWSRYAEISADRAGAWCAQDIEAVAHSLFKLASGLSSGYAQFSLADFLRQVDDMQLERTDPGHGAPTEDWFLTHPFSPLRVKALALFHDSVLSGNGTQSAEQLDVGVHELMAMMEPSYLQARTDVAEAMRRLLFAGAIAVAVAKDGISAEEIAVFEKFFGARTFSDKLDHAKIQAELPDRIQQVRAQTSLPQRMQVMRDLVLIARADGAPPPEERQVLLGIAHGLGISSCFIDQAIHAETELD